MEIDQLTSHQLHGHGIDREITSHQISGQRSGLHDGVFCRCRVMLLPGRSEIKGRAIQLERHGAEGSVLLQGLQPV